MEVCRLCLLNQSHHISIFSDFEPNKNVANVISQHVGEVSETDPLPKHVCHDCWKYTKSFHEFHIKVHAAQSNYLKELIKCEQESHFVEVPVDVNVVVSESEPNDGLHEVNELPNETAIKIEYDACKNDASVSPKLEQIDAIDVESDADAECGAYDDSFEMNSSEQTDEDTDSGSDVDYDVVTAKRQLKSIETKNSKYQYKREFICDLCESKLSSKQRLLDHLLRHVRYKCQICSEKCFSRRALETHNKANHSQDAAKKARKQLDELEPILNEVVSQTQIDTILSKHSDPVCDYCKDHLMPSLENAQEHYERKHNADGYVKCCEIQLKTIDDVSSHVLTHLHPEHFRCTVCGKIGKRSSNFRTHLSKHLIDIQKYPHMCVKCDRGFARDDLLEVHMKYYHEDDDPVIEKTESNQYTLASFFTMRCDIDACDKEFTTFQDARLHYKSVHGVTGYLICCSKKFVKAKTIDNHFQWHINPELNKCEICGKCFKQKVTFASHMLRHNYKKQKRFQCPDCGKAFLSNYYVKMHRKVHDQSIKKSLQCPECDKRYTTPKSLENHILFVHKNEPKNSEMCEFCGKRFISRTSVLNHIQNVHRSENEFDNQNNPIARSHCTMCSASFINKYRLKKHVETIHLGKPVKCSQCDKVAPNESALICHIRSVHVAHSYLCHLCSKSFKAAVALKDHIATHTGEKTYKCAFCPEAFIWRPNMYSHQKKAHPEEWKELKTQARRRSNKI